MEKMGEIVIYSPPSESPHIEVKLQGETLWLSQRLMAELFEKDQDTIGLHIKNIFLEGELEENPTTEDSSVVQLEGKRKVKRNVKLYNLDVILSVGYRVNSKRGTDFRIWANKVLKSYLTKGYVLDQKRFEQQSRQLDDLRQTVKLLGNVIESKPLNTEEATGLLKVITDYTYALDVLDKYDQQLLEIDSTTREDIFQITYKEALKAIQKLKDRFGGSSLFGNEKDDSFKGSLAGIYQTFNSKDLYPSVEEKAANLLFIWFLEKNRILYRPDGTKKIADNALVALTLMIAESKPEEKEMMIKVVVNLTNLKN
jgi:Virulence protein RhuM family